MFRHNRCHVTGFSMWNLPMSAILVLVILVFAIPSTAEVMPAKAASIDAQQAFAKLESLAGTWKGPAMGQGGAEVEAAHADQVVHEIVLSAAGTVVMETMRPGTDHEMINMYHLDGEDLLLTHYCAGGNQPVLRLDRAASSLEKLVFGFVGGTNFDPAVDEHIHGAEIRLVKEGQIESVWTGYSAGKQAGVMTFDLTRSE